MQLDLFAQWRRQRISKPECLTVGAASVPVQFISNRRARRYILRVRRDGTVRVTIPRGGTIAFAVTFAQENEAWLSRQMERRRAETQPTPWTDGTTILFRGEPIILKTLTEGASTHIQLAEHAIPTTAESRDLRPVLEKFLRHRATAELPGRTLELARVHGISVHRVVVRGQRTRWGSCSRQGTISLNWRLIHAPPFVRDYLILHELMHRREMNHSSRFWRLVEAAVPGYEQAEAWLNAHASLIR